MPGTDFYRALATVKFIRGELLVERDAHNAMKMCFKKIHESLDMYQGHFINRLRFHLNRHHTEYLRKVRVMRKEKSDGSQDEDDAAIKLQNPTRRSMRVGIAADLANEVEQLKTVIKRKDLEIQRLAMLLDEADDGDNDEHDEMDKAAAGSAIKRESASSNENKTIPIQKLTNPYYPSDDDEICFAAIDTHKAE